MRFPKITKYRVVVITGGNSVCCQILEKREISLMKIVLNAMSCCRAVTVARPRYGCGGSS